MNVLRMTARGRVARWLRRSTTRSVALAATLAVSLPVLGAVTASPAAAAVGDEVIAWVEVEDGVPSGGPVFNSGDHGNFSGTGSYTFRETGMMSTMNVNAPEAGVYPVYVRYAAGPLSPAEDITRSMGLITNGARQLMSLPMTSYSDWETWRFVTYNVTLNQGANTIAIQCNRATDFCRLNFDAIQVGGLAPDPCVATEPGAGYTSLFDGTFESFDGWRKAASGGFGRTPDCTIRTFRGRGATWFTQQQTGPYTLEVDWRRDAASDDSSVYLGSSSRSGADPAGGFRIPIGANTGAIVPTGAAMQGPDPAALAEALRPLGQWNTYSIQLTEARVKLYLNGTLINSLDRSAPAPMTGFIGLENVSSADRVDFRDIKISPDFDLIDLAAPFTRAELANGATNLGGESTLGNLVAETYRWAVGAQANRSAEIAFVHPDSLGADMLGRPGDYPTPLTYQQASAVLPSSDTLINMRLTGAQIKTVLEQQWQPTGGEPAHPFLRLGTSKDFTYSYDPTATAGDRITDVLLEGAALGPATNYSVTVPSSLADSDDFPGFRAGTNQQDSGTVGLTALLDYVGDLADTQPGGGLLEPDFVQHSVGVSFPTAGDGFYAGGALDVDLTSLAFSGAADVKDDSVEVRLGSSRVLGSFDVVNSLGNNPHDEYGTAAIRATIPSDMPAGRATVNIVGNNTGTTVSFPITVAVKAASTTSVSVTPASVSIGDTASVSISVTAPGTTPTGDVEVLVDGDEPSTVTLAGGTATATVGPFTTAGTRSVVARYVGSPTVGTSESSAATITVKGNSTTSASVSPASVSVGGTASVSISVAAQGTTPTGQADVLVDGVKTSTVTLADGKATATVGPFATAGTRSVEVRYLGSATTNPSSSPAATVTVTVATVAPKVASKVALTVQPKKLTARRNKAKVAINVTAAGTTPTGQVEVLVNGKKATTVTLVNGKATATVGPFATAGTRSVQVRYLGSATTNPSSSPAATVRVVKAAAKLRVKVQPRKITAKKTRATVAIRVAVPGRTAAGKVRVKIGKKTYTRTLKQGRTTLKLPRFAKAGKARVTVRYLGNASTKAASARVNVKVAKAGRK